MKKKFSNNNNICIIPLRSKSKGIKNKNIKKINNIPLCLYSLIEAYKSKKFSKIVIASDSNNYFKLIKKNLEIFKIDQKKIDFFKRSKKSSGDKAPTEIVINEVLKVNKNYNYCCLLQATSPLVIKKDFVNSIDLIKKKALDSLFSGFKSKKFIWTMYNDVIKSLNYNYKKRPMRQEFNKNLVENGAFYMFKVKKFNYYKNRLFGKIGFYEMPERRSIEIDEKEDLNFVTKILAYKKLFFFPKRIEAIISDIDGVLTDGQVILSKNNEPSIKFSVTDGQGGLLCRKNNIQLFALSSNNKYKILTEQRLKEIGFNKTYFGIKNKEEQFNNIIKKYNLKLENVVYLGDDIIDIPIMKKNSILSFAPENAQTDVKKFAKITLENKYGGKNFFRTVCDIIIKSNNNHR